VKQRESINCPVCKSSNIENILNLNCGRFDNSSLYRNAVVNGCNDCGHIYNGLCAEEVEALIKYYNEEYAPINMSALYKTGNMPGGDGPVAFERYNALYHFISPYIDHNSRILDVGCAMGGFLDYLNQKGVNNLAGIDLIENFVKHVKQKGKYDIKLGSAESIPFGDNSFDVLIVNQVIEHMIDPSKIFKEAKRILVKGGIIYLGVPDASRYEDTCSFDFYWLLIRDHIHHFDIKHLNLLAKLEGFELLYFSNNDYLALSAELALPNLNVIFRRTDKQNELNISEDCFKLKKKFKKYLTTNFEKLNKKKQLIDDLIASQNPLYAWGIGSEFLYLYENTRLKYCNIEGLIDINPYKQKNLMVGGLSIAAPHILTSADIRSKLIITAVAYKKVIMRKLVDINFKGQIIDL
jgi:SAM-dependent methyltransferase